MKVVAFNGSARKDGNTSILVRAVFEPLEAAGVTTELVPLAGESVHGCRACGWCGKNEGLRCRYDDDVVNECIARMIDADGILLASPTYFSDVTAEMKALIDRAGSVVRNGGFALRHKVGAGVVAVRRGGAIHTFDTLNHFFLINQMIVVGSRYWNDGIGHRRGEVSDDEEGLDTMRILGENMGWLLERLAG